MLDVRHVASGHDGARHGEGPFGVVRGFANPPLAFRIAHVSRDDRARCAFEASRGRRDTNGARPRSRASPSAYRWHRRSRCPSGRPRFDRRSRRSYQRIDFQPRREHVMTSQEVRRSGVAWVLNTMTSPTLLTSCPDLSLPSAVQFSLRTSLCVTTPDDIEDMWSTATDGCSPGNVHESQRYSMPSRTP